MNVLPVPPEPIPAAKRVGVATATNTWRKIAEQARVAAADHHFVGEESVAKHEDHGLHVLPPALLPHVLEARDAKV